MRKTLFALAATALMAGVAFVGCGDDSNVEVGDMASKTDGPVTTGDMAVAKVGCNGYIVCFNECFANDPNATSSGCSTMCGKTAKSGATAKFNDALACGQEHCLGNIDAMSGKCKLSADMTKLINQDGSDIMQSDPTTGTTGTKDCGACLNDSLARLFGDTCTNMSSVDCNPTECKTVTDTCLNDTP